MAEIDTSAADQVPDWFVPDDMKTHEGMWIAAQLGWGQPIETVCKRFVHPGTGLAPTPDQLRAAFPQATEADAASQQVVFALFQDALTAERDRVKHQTLWLTTQARNKFAPPSTKVDVNINGDIEHRHKIAHDAIADVNMIIDGLARDIKVKSQLEAQKLVEEAQRNAEDATYETIP